MSRPLGRDVGLFVAGAALFGWSLVLARRPGIDPIEEDVFRAANDAPDAITIPVRSVMQMGTFGTVPVVSAVALLARKVGGAGLGMMVSAVARRFLPD